MITNILFALAVATAPTATPPAEATPPALECVTPDVVVGDIIRAIPDADIKEMAKEPPMYIIFTSPSKSNDFKVYFDENNCLVNAEEIPKSIAS
jgi:hypothetical protein